MKPAYQHDCSKCQFVGPLEVDGIEHWDPSTTSDVYVCPQADEADDAPSIIVRYSDEGDDYESMMLSEGVKKYLEEHYYLTLGRAYQIAKERGIIK